MLFLMEIWYRVPLRKHGGIWGGAVREAGSDSRKLMGSTHQNLYFLPVGQRRSSSETAKDVSQGEHL